MVKYTDMTGMMLLVKETLRRRKKQYIFLTLTLFLSTVLLCVAYNLLTMTSQPFDDNFRELKASHLLLFMDATVENYDQIYAWYLKQPEVLQVSKPVPYTLAEGGFTVDGKQIKVDAHLTEYILQHNQDSLVVLNPAAGPAPNYDEVWLPYHFSANYDLEVGDTLHFQFGTGSHSLVISSFIIDPHYLSSLFNPTRIFMAPGAMAIYQPLDRLGEIMVGIRMEHPDHLSNVYSRFLSEFDFTGTQLQYQLFKSAFTGIFSMFSAVLLIFSLMIFLIVLLILNGTISSQIYSDNKQIGVLKILGFTPSGIRAMYLLKLLFLSLTAIPLGLVAAHLSMVMIISYMNSSTGLDYSTSPQILNYILSGLLIFILTLLTTLNSTYRVGQVSALQALQKEFSNRRNNRIPVRYRNFPSVIIIGIQFLFQQPKSSLILLSSFSILSFLVLFVSGVGSSLEQMKSNKPAWGIMDADLQISLNKTVFMPLDKDEFMTLFSQFQQRTEKLIPFGYSNLKILSDSTFEEIRGVVYDINLKDTGFTNLLGNHPQEAGEIALGVGSAKKLNAKVDDSIMVFLEGGQHQMKVCGIYQDISTFGQGFRLHASAMETINPLFEADQIGLTLADSEDPDQFKRAVSSFFGEKIEVTESIEQRKAFLSMIGNLRIGIMIISIFFILIISIMVANDLNIHILRDRLVIAKLKATGFTDFQVKCSFLFKNSLLMLTGILSGLLLAVVLGKPLISSLTSGMGLPNFPYLISFLIVSITLLTILLFGYLSSWFAMREIPDIQPIHLNTQ